MNVIRVDVVAQAHQMLEHLDTTRPGAAARLYVDALSELGTWTEVQLRRVPDTSTQRGCSVAGGYVHTTTPPTLTVARSLSVRRQQFTALHELGHHLQKNDARLALSVRRQPADQVAFEDAACDLFASLVLIPDAVLPTTLDGRAPSAADVVSLFDNTQASRAACCVRIAGQLGTPGVVSVLDADGTVSFAAGHGEFPPARGSNQASTPLVAAALRRGTDARVDDTYVQYRNGSRSQLLYGDARWSDQYLVTIAVLDRPSWKQFAPPRSGSGTFTSQEWSCEVCGDEFVIDARCARCATPRCPSRHCACTAAAERQCQSCFQLLAPSRFTSKDADVCRDCTE